MALRLVKSADPFERVERERDARNFTTITIKSASTEGALYMFVPRIGSKRVVVRATTFKKARKLVRKPWFGWSSIWVITREGDKIKIG